MAMDMQTIEALYSEPTDAPLDHTGVSGYRTQTIKSGAALEVNACPIVINREMRRKMRGAVTSAAQERVNATNRWRRVARLLNANFGAGDVWITLTYNGACPEQDRARKDVRNFLDRVKRLRKKRGLPEFKYLGTIEHADGEGETVRLHHHIVMSGGLDRDELEGMWPHGYAQTRRLQPDPDYGLDGMARYIVKGARVHAMMRKPGVTRWRSWTCSRNLIQPRVTVADHKLSRRRVERMAADLPGAAKEIFERLYKGYRFLSVDVRTAGDFPGAYIYVRMVRD